VSACDIADAAQVAQFEDLVLSEFGAVDVLINNAALLDPCRHSRMVEATWDRVMDVNVNGLFSITKAFLPSMIGQHAGSIINVSSSVGKVGKRRWGRTPRPSLHLKDSRRCWQRKSEDREFG